MMNERFLMDDNRGYTVEESHLSTSSNLLFVQEQNMIWDKPISVQDDEPYVLDI
ncbi:hypothetical protein [Aquirhabdus sp.]|uniref:hypothetical protein n=1 Tax=Aquirhabdus sp. TaxID=2824160 RepID=UPI00396C80AE